MPYAWGVRGLDHGDWTRERYLLKFNMKTPEFIWISKRIPNIELVQCCWQPSPRIQQNSRGCMSNWKCDSENCVSCCLKIGEQSKALDFLSNIWNSKEFVPEPIMLVISRHYCNCWNIFWCGKCLSMPLDIFFQCPLVNQTFAENRPLISASIRLL